MPGIDETVSVTYVIKVLNRAVKADPGAIGALVCARVRCNEELADDPTIQVSASNELGVIGLLNGIFGADAVGWGTIAGVWAVVCPGDRKHEVEDNEVVGDHCRTCGEELVLGELLRFEDSGRR